MKTTTYLAAVLLATTSTSWAAPQCVPWDYARIKDAKQEDLVELACSSQKKAMDQYAESMEAISGGGFNWKAESEAAAHAQAVCLDQAKQAITVLREKFGAKAKCSPQ